MRVPATPTEDHHAAFRHFLSTANQAFPQFSLCFLAFLLVFSGFLQLLRQFSRLQRTRNHQNSGRRGLSAATSSGRFSSAISGAAARK
jgi:hypothetical protein